MTILDDASPLLADPLALRAQLAAEGFLMLRGVLDAAQVLAAGRDCLAELDRGGIPVGTPGDPYAFDWTRAPADYAERRPRVLRRMYGLESVNLLFHTDSMVRVGQLLADEDQVLVNPRKEARFQPPQRPGAAPQKTGAHQDHLYNQGSTEMFTAWVPLAPTSHGMGGLEVVPRSHLGGLVEAGTVEDGAITYTLAGEPDDSDWYRPAYQPGDCIFFHSLTMHRAGVNSSSRVRLSVDCRYQGLSQPFADEIMVPLPGLTDSYPEWSNTDLQYYWEGLDLKRVPYHPERIPGYVAPS